MKNLDPFNPLSAKRVEADTKRPITKQTLLSTDRKCRNDSGSTWNFCNFNYIHKIGSTSHKACLLAFENMSSNFQLLSVKLVLVQATVSAVDGASNPSQFTDYNNPSLRCHKAFPFESASSNKFSKN